MQPPPLEFTLVSANLPMLALGILLAVVGIILFRGTFKSKKLAGDALKDQAKKGVLALTACANLTGMLTGCFGVGGGFVVVHMLILALGLNIMDASGTSLLVMVISSATGLISRIGEISPWNGRSSSSSPWHPWWADWLELRRL